MPRTFQWLAIQVAVLGLAIGLSFGGGMLYGRRTADGNAAAAGDTAVPKDAVFIGSPSGASGPLTVGRVESITDTSLTLNGPGGASVVTLTPETEFRRTEPATPADVKPGQTVTATGVAGADGTLSARSLAIGGEAGVAGVALPASGGAQPNLQTVAGEVERVDGTTVRVRTASGPTTVNLAADAQITRSAPAQRGDITGGQFVQIAGISASDGKLQARTVTIQGGVAGTSAPGGPAPGASPAARP